MKNIIIAILLIAVIVLLLLPKKTETITIQGDSIFVSVPVPVEIIKTQWRDKPIDTLAVLEDYFSRVKYIQRLPVEKLGYVDVNFELTQNRVFEMNYSYDFKLPKPKKNSIGVMIMPGDIMPMYSRQIMPNVHLSGGWMINQKSPMIGLHLKF
jgi:hypothetical protein